MHKTFCLAKINKAFTRSSNGEFLELVQLLATFVSITEEHIRVQLLSITGIGDLTIFIYLCHLLIQKKHDQNMS